MGAAAKLLTPLMDQASYDDDFFDDMLGVFPDASGYAPKAGWCSKYIYDADNWDNVIEHSENYYAPRVEKELGETAIKDIDAWDIPDGTPYIDLGVGCPSSFTRYALPVMQRMRSPTYIGVDFCTTALQKIRELAPQFRKNFDLKTRHLDLFFPTTRVLSRKHPALGVMNGLTLTNLYGKRDSDANLIDTLKYLSQLCGHGWLLLSIDTNQNEKSLRQAYKVPSLSQLFLSVLYKMERELPVENFDPSRFTYEPDFRMETQLLAHTARATESQDFTLGPYPIHVEKGQKIHLVNSYKWRREFFEACCTQAGLSVMKSWSHETGMMLYLLKDNLCTIAEPARSENIDIQAA